MKNAEREPLQRRFAELYVEKASGLRVHPNDLINGLRSTIGREAIIESGYPVASYIAGQAALGLTRNPKINSWIKQLATDQLERMPQDKRPLTLRHLSKYGRLSMPDYEAMASNLSITVDELKQHGDAPSIVAYYHRTRSEVDLNNRLAAMSEYLSADELAELRELHNERVRLHSARFSPLPSEARVAIESRLDAIQGKVDSLEAVAYDKAELANLEPKIADGSLFDHFEDVARAIYLGIDVKAIIDAKKAELVHRFGDELGPELDDLLNKYETYQAGQTLHSYGLFARKRSEL